MEKKKAAVLAIVTALAFTHCAADSKKDNEDQSRYLGYSKVSWAEGYYSRSPDQKWTLNLITGATDNQSYSNIFLFDTTIYPELKNKDTKPSKFQMNNPRAQYLVPVKYSARESEIDWDLKNHFVVIKYSNLKYRIDLHTFSFQKID